MKDLTKGTQGCKYQHNHLGTVKLSRKEDEMKDRERMLSEKPTILVADDDPAMLKLLSRVLETESCQVVATHDSTTVLKLTATTKSLALVTLEFDGPAPNGIELCRRLRKFSRVPVIILAAKYDEHDIVRGLEAGADDFITKPVGMVEFVARVQTVLRCSRSPLKYSLST